MVSHMFFFPQDEIKRRIRQRKCSRSSWKKKDWNFSDGVNVPVIAGGPRTQGKRVHAMHHAGIHQKARGCRKGSRHSIVCSTCSTSCSLNRVMTTLMLYLCPAERSYTKECFWWDSFVLFFADLQNPEYQSAIAMVHSRFSTNTNPSWDESASEPFYRT